MWEGWEQEGQPFTYEGKDYIQVVDVATGERRYYCDNDDELCNLGEFE